MGQPPTACTEKRERRLKSLLLKEIPKQRNLRACSNYWSLPPQLHHWKNQILARDLVTLLLKPRKLPKNLLLVLDPTPAPLLRHLRSANPTKIGLDWPDQGGQLSETEGGERGGEGEEERVPVFATTQAFLCDWKDN
jgi:hypothetical protein